MKKIFILFIVALNFSATSVYASKLEDFLDRKVVQKKLSERIADIDVNFGIDLANIDLIDGINLSSQYSYAVEASNINKLYTRVDKWDLAAGINVGEILEDAFDVPFTFSVNRNKSFFFVRQFKDKLKADKALPYTPSRLPLNAKLALENLSAGDFVSIPANLSIAVGLQATTSTVAPILLNADAAVYYVMSGEFTIQVFKLDETHVRLKLITKRENSSGGKVGAGISFNAFGIKIIDHEIERLVDLDLAQYGYTFNPGANFIIDYIFDLKNEEAQVAYNQILSSTLKFKDIVATKMIDAKELKNKFIASYEKADELASADKNKNPSDRRVQSIFKGYNNYSGHTRHLNYSVIIASYTKDRALTDSKITYVDKDGKNLDFYYPTSSKYVDSNIGKWFLSLEDQHFQNNFGLIPRKNSSHSEIINPDFGFTYERKDRYFIKAEQKSAQKFLMTQIPAEIAKNIDLSLLKDGKLKKDSRIFFQLVLKSQGFAYLKNIPFDEMKEKLFTFVSTKRTDQNFNYFEKKKLTTIAKSLTEILNTENAEEMIKRLVALNEHGDFDQYGIGFLVSLLPEEKLKDLIYLKLEMFTQKFEPITISIGTLNYRAVYNELNQIQSRLSNRNNDLRIYEEDQNIKEVADIQSAN